MFPSLFAIYAFLSTVSAATTTTTSTGCVSEQAAARDLGYTQTIWDNESGAERQPPANTKYWTQLTDREKAAAHVLKYTEKIWDNKSGSEPQPDWNKPWAKLSSCSSDINSGSNSDSGSHNDKMPCTSERTAAEALGYSEGSWNGHTLGKDHSQSKYWPKLTDSEKAAAKVLGYNQTTWDNMSKKEPQPFSSTKTWAHLTSSEQAAAALLGYNETKWDYTGSEQPPASWNKHWAQLTENEKAAAKALGYTEKIWDNVSGSETQPASADKFWEDLTTCVPPSTTTAQATTAPRASGDDNSAIRVQTTGLSLAVLIAPFFF